MERSFGANTDAFKNNVNRLLAKQWSSVYAACDRFFCNLRNHGPLFSQSCECFGGRGAASFAGGFVWLDQKLVFS
jgi:hypothetical protein